MILAVLEHLEHHHFPEIDFYDRRLQRESIHLLTLARSPRKVFSRLRHPQLEVYGGEFVLGEEHPEILEKWFKFFLLGLGEVECVKNFVGVHYI